MLEFEVRTVMADDITTQRSTVYLFNKEHKILLPIKMNTYASNKILLAKEGSCEARPHIHNTVTRIIKALRGRMESVIIYGYHNDIYYAYLRIKHENKSMDIDCKPSDALSIALREKLSVFVEKHVYESTGIKVTPELLARSL